MAELLKMGHGGTVYTMGASFFFFLLCFPFDVYTEICINNTRIP